MVQGRKEKYYVSKGTLIGLWIAIILVIFLTLSNLIAIASLQLQLNSYVNDMIDRESRENNAVQNSGQIGTQNEVKISYDRPITRIIGIVAVTNDNRGIVENVSIRLIPGSNDVLINTNPFLEPDIQYSAQLAVNYAMLKTKLGKDVDYIFDFNAGEAQLIGGGSAGGAMTVMTIAALQNEELRDDVIMTGTIEQDGTIGKVSGLIEKAQAAGEEGYRYFLVPEGQSTATYYERQLTEKTIRGFTFYRTIYVPKVVDLKELAMQDYNMTVVEVHDIDDALKYFLD